MKSFNEWLKEKNEGFRNVGLRSHMGAVPAIRALNKKGAIGQNQSYSYDKEEDDKQPWYNKDLMQYVPGTSANKQKKFALEDEARKAKLKKDEENLRNDLIKKGWNEKDAENWIKLRREGSLNDSALARQYGFLKKYPNYFAGR